MPLRLCSIFMRDRADVALVPRRVRALARRLVVEDDAILAVHLRGHHGRFCARRQLAWVHGVLRAEREPDRDGETADARNLQLGEALDEPLRHAAGVHAVARAHDHAELLATEAADDVVWAYASAHGVRERAEQLVTDAVSVHVVDALEVVDVEHEDGNRTVRPARLLQRVQQSLVEASVVEQAGERVRLRLVLEASPDLGVVERERGGIGEALCKLELVGREEAVLADPVDVQNALDARERSGESR